MTTEEIIQEIRANFREQIQAAEPEWNKRAILIRFELAILKVQTAILEEESRG